MRQLTAADFKQAETKKVEIPELDGFVHIKKLSVKDAKQFQKDDLSSIDRGEEMIVMAVVDESGNRIFSSVEQLEESGIEHFQKLTESILEFNGLSNKELKEIEKN